MKKMIYILIGILCLSGCWTEERNYRPKKTGYANSLFQAVREELLQATVYLDAAKKVDLWNIASSGPEKEKVEDNYFNKYKVRQRNDTIALLAIDGYADVLFITGGKRITEPTAQWKIVRRFDTLMIRTQAEQNWSVSLLPHPMAPGQMNLTAVSGNGNGSYEIEGDGITRQGYVTEVPVAYKTEKPIAFLLPLGQVDLSPSYGSKITLQDGKILFEARGLSGADPASAVLLQGGQYTITYKGFTEGWTGYGY